jgi:flagellum-specific ATP synthase
MDAATAPAPARRQRHAGRWKSYLNDCAELVGFAEPMQVRAASRAWPGW